MEKKKEARETQCNNMEQIQVTSKRLDNENSKEPTNFAKKNYS